MLRGTSKVYGFGFALLALAGCTGQLKSTALSSAAPVTGIPYALPEARLKLDLARQITACSVEVYASADAAAVAFKDLKAANPNAKEKTQTLKPGAAGRLDLAVDITAAISAETAPDPTAVYSIDPKELQTFFNTSTLEIKYGKSPLVLSAVNADATDKTGTMINNMVVGAGKIAAAVAGVPTVVPQVDPNALKPQKTPPTYQKLTTTICTDAVLKAIDTVAEGKKTLKTLKTALDALKAQLDKAKAGTPAKTQLEVQVNDAQFALDQATADLADALKAVAFDEHIERTPVLSTSATTLVIGTTDTAGRQKPVPETLATPADDFAKFFDTGRVAAFVAFTSSSPALGAVLLPPGVGFAADGAGKPTKVTVQGVTFDMTIKQLTAWKNAGLAAPTQAPSGAGLYYRLPLQAKVMLCTTACTDGAAVEQRKILLADDAMVTTADVAIPQFGATASISFENKIFDAKSLNATFNDDGTLATIKIASTAARSDAVGTIFGSAVEASKAGLDASTSRTVVDTQLEGLKRQNAILEQQILLKKNRADLAAP